MLVVSIPLFVDKAKYRFYNGDTNLFLTPCRRPFCCFAWPPPFAAHCKATLASAEPNAFQRAAKAPTRKTTRSYFT